jgi:hypothetical protein
MSGSKPPDPLEHREPGWCTSDVLRVITASGCALLGALVVIQSAGGSDPWAKLHRRLHLPHIVPGSPCPVSPIDHRVAWRRTHIFGQSGIGRGPVYPGLGGSGGMLNATPDTTYGGPWAGGKVFWYVKRSYRGRVLIRGRRLDNSQQWLGFSGDKVPAARELRIEPWDTAVWEGQIPGSRGMASTVRVLTPGCYGVQIDGTTFSRVVVFIVGA